MRISHGNFILENSEYTHGYTVKNTISHAYKCIYTLTHIHPLFAYPFSCFSLNLSITILII